MSLVSFDSIAAGDDTKKLPAMFRMEPVKNEAKSKAEGRAIYDTVEFIQIIFPGDHTREINRPASDFDKEKYADEYRRFKDHDEQAFSGTPLEAWGALPAGTVAEMKALRIYTVEHLANLSELAITKLGMGGREHMNKAIAFLSKGQDSDNLRARVAELEAQIHELTSQKSAEDDGNKAPRIRRTPEQIAAGITLEDIKNGNAT